MKDKRSDFVRLAEKRMERLTECFRLLGNLSNNDNYDYSEEDLEKIYTEINKQYKKMKQKFKDAQSNKNRKRFTLNEDTTSKDDDKEMLSEDLSSK